MQGNPSTMQQFDSSLAVAGHPELFFLDAPSHLGEGRREDRSIWADFQFFGQLRRVEEVEALFEIALGVGQKLAG